MYDGCIAERDRPGINRHSKLPLPCLPLILPHNTLFCRPLLHAGPLTLVLLARLAPGLTAEAALQRVLPAYRQLLRQLREHGAPEVQLHEPSLATDAGQAALPLLRDAYAALAQEACPIDLVIPYADVSASVLQAAVALPLAALSLDFVGVPGAATPNHTAERVAELAKAGGWPESLRLGAGVIDGRSVWRDDTGERCLLHRFCESYEFWYTWCPTAGTPVLMLMLLMMMLLDNL